MDIKDTIDRIVGLEKEKSTLAEDIKGEYEAAKASGMDTKVIRKLVTLLVKDKIEEHKEFEAHLEDLMNQYGVQ